MVFLGVYYTSLDIGELGAEGLMISNWYISIIPHCLTKGEHFICTSVFYFINSLRAITSAINTRAVRIEIIIDIIVILLILSIML